MNKIVIPLIALAVIITTISIVYLVEQQVPQDKKSNMHDKDTKTLEELTAMTCEEILKENVKGLQYFTEEGGEYIQEKVFECMKNQIPVEDTYQLPKQESELESLRELSYLVEMTCEEIIHDTYNRIDGYESSENREFARDEVKQCVRNQDTMVREASCFEVFT